jgi:hypothetical protein
MARRRVRKAALLIAASTVGCGFVAGVDFFGLERAEVRDAAADTSPDGPGPDGGANDAPIDVVGCSESPGCADFDDCVELDVAEKQVSAGNGVVLEVTRQRSHSPPCALHAELATSDGGRRTSAHRSSTTLGSVRRVDVDFWMYVEDVDKTPASGSTKEGQAPVASMTFSIPNGSKPLLARTQFAVGATESVLLGDEGGGASVQLDVITTVDLIGAWRRVRFLVERTPNRLTARVEIDGRPYLEGRIDNVPVDPTSVVVLTGLVDALTRSSKSSVIVDDVLVTTIAP